MENRWGNNGSSQRLYLLIYLLGGGSKITAAGDCIDEIEKHLLLGRKLMTNLDSILKSGNYLPAMVCPDKAVVFPVVMYGCEIWTIMKLSAEELLLLICGLGEDS